MVASGMAEMRPVGVLLNGTVMFAAFEPEAPMTPLERAARAVYKLGDNGPYGPEDEDEQWHQHVDVARAVLQAIREPSEAMEEAGDSCLGLATSPVIWQAMIDAALEEG